MKIRWPYLKIDMSISGIKKQVNHDEICNQFKNQSLPGRLILIQGSVLYYNFTVHLLLTTLRRSFQEITSRIQIWK